MSTVDAIISPSGKSQALAARMLASPWLPISLLLVLYLIIGAVTVVDYGESWDEQKRYLYATQSLAAYSRDYVGLRSEKGPFYVMIDKLGNTLPVAVNGLKSMFQEFFRMLGQPVITQLTQDMISLRNWVRDNQDAFQGLAQALGEGAMNAFQRLRGFIGDLLGLEDFSPMRFFEAGVELMTNWQTACSPP